MSPLLNATGIATKNFGAMAKGLPVLTTAMGTAGLLLPPTPSPLCCSAGATADDAEPAACQLPARGGGHGVRGDLVDQSDGRPRRSSLASDCARQPGRMECQAWREAKAYERSVGGDRRGRGPAGGTGAAGPVGGAGGVPSRVGPVRGEAAAPAATAGSKDKAGAKRGRKAGAKVGGSKAAKGNPARPGARTLLQLPDRIDAVSEPATVGGLGRVAPEGVLPRSLLEAMRPGALSSARVVMAETSRSANGAGGRTPSELAKPAHPALHPSGALLVADAPRLFAKAAVAALSDDRLWSSLSRRGTRQLRSLAPPRQSAVLARALEGDLLLELPAEQACVLIAERGAPEGVRTLIDAMLRLRVAVHVLLVPEAGPGSERDTLGWGRAQGVFFYAGSPQVRARVPSALLVRGGCGMIHVAPPHPRPMRPAPSCRVQEQWGAMVAATPAPPIRFAIMLQPSLSEIAREIARPECVMSVPPAPLCLWTTTRHSSDADGTTRSSLRDALATITHVLREVGVGAGGSDGGGVGGAEDDSVVANDDRQAGAGSTGALQLARCIGAVLPLLLVSSSSPAVALAQSLSRRVRPPAEATAAKEALRLALLFEAALAERARLVLASSLQRAHQLAALSESALARRAPSSAENRVRLVPEGTPSARDLEWTEILSDLLATQLDRVDFGFGDPAMTNVHEP